MSDRLRAAATEAESAVAGEDVVGAGDGGDGEEGAEFEDDDAKDGCRYDDRVGIEEEASGADVQAAAFAREDRREASEESCRSTEDVERDVRDVRGGVAMEHGTIMHSFCSA